MLVLDVDAHKGEQRSVYVKKRPAVIGDFIGFESEMKPVQTDSWDLTVELGQQFTSEFGLLAQPLLICDQMAIHPDRVNATRIGVQAGRATWQVKHAVFGAASHGFRIEQQQIGREVFANPSALFQTEDARRLRCEFVHGLGHRHHPQVSGPMPQ
jgi:hypothetical protein